MSDNSSTGVRPNRRNILKLVGSSIGAAGLAAGTTSGEGSQKVHYNEAGVRYRIDSDDPNDDAYARYETDNIKSFDVHSDGIHLREWTREDDRDKLTNGPPVLFSGSLLTIPKLMQSSRDVIALATSLGTDLQPTSGVTLDSPTTLTEVQVRPQGKKSTIKANGKSATADLSQTIEMTLDSRKVTVCIETVNSGRSQTVSATPIIELTNYGLLDVYE